MVECRPFKPEDQGSSPCGCTKFMKIFKALVGSRAYGTGMPGSDYDSLVAYVNPIDYYIGAFTKSKDSNMQQDNGIDVASYEIRKFVQMCAAFNPNAIVALYSPVVDVDDNWAWLTTERKLFSSYKAIDTFCGFAYQELTRADKSDNRHFSSKRTDLIEKYGFDTKSAQNAIRLSRMLLEYLNDKEHRLQVVRHDDYQYLLDIRNGKVSLNECKREFEKTRAEVNKWIESPTTELPKEPNYDAINKLFMASIRKLL